jgi:AsmA protein
MYAEVPVKRIAKWIGIFLAVLILAVVGMPFLINVDQFRPTLQSELTRVLGREVTLGNLRLKLLRGEVTADDLSVAEDPAFGKPAFIKAQSLHVGVELWPFIMSRKLIVTNLTIDQPDIELVQAPSGNWNFSSLGGKSPTPSSWTPSSTRVPINLSVQLVRVSNGRVTLRKTTGHWKPLVLEQGDIELRDFSSTSIFPFSVSARVRGGGVITLNGNIGPLNPTDSAMTPVTANLNVTQLDLAGSGVNDVAPGVAGLVSIIGSGTSDGTNLQVKAKLKAERLRLATKGRPATRPVELDFSVQHNLRNHSGVLHQGDIHIGKATAHLTGTYTEHGDFAVLNMKLAGPDMPVQELEALLPALGVELPAGTSLQGGNASANLLMEGPADRLVASGSLAINNTRLTGFDLPKRMASIEKLAGIKGGPDTDIQTLSANLRSAPDGISAQEIRLVVPAIGDLSGGGTISSTNALDFRMSAIVHTSGLLAIIGNKPIPFSVEGSCSDPIFKPDVMAVAKEEVKSIGNDIGKAASDLFKGLTGGRKKN